MALGLYTRLQSYLFPLALLAISFYSLLLTLLEILTLRLPPAILLSKADVSEKIFSKTWLRISPSIFQFEQTLTPIPKLLSHAHGTILELGPGSGNQLSRYDKSRVTRIYGVEPNKDLHAALLKKVKEEGLSDVYRVVERGVEDVDAGVLGEWGEGEGEGVDCVVCVQVLCSVPAEKLEGVVRGLYQCLKKGGELIFYEHVRSDDRVSGFVQNVYNHIWPFFMGNCHLDRPIGEMLLKAGKWESVELEPRKEEDDWAFLPRVAGRLVK